MYVGACALALAGCADGWDAVVSVDPPENSIYEMKDGRYDMIPVHRNILIKYDRLFVPK